MSEPPAAPPNFRTHDVAELYRQTFAARLDAYADWAVTHDGSCSDSCSCHWVANRHDLTVDRVLDGLTARNPVSTYMEDAAGLTHLGAIDFDSEDGWQLALRVAARLGEAGAFPMVERSRRGGHLWLVLDGRLAGLTVRLGLRYFAELARPGAGRDPRVEILPKPVNRTPDTVGNPLRMPMMSHQRTGERHPLCNGEGQPLGGSVSAVMLAIDQTPRQILLDAAARVKVPASEVHVPAWARRPAREGGDVVTILVEHGIDRAAPGRTIRCPLHDDQQASMTISRDAERVWCHAPACQAHNGGRGMGADQLAAALEPHG